MVSGGCGGRSQDLDFMQIGSVADEMLLGQKGRRWDVVHLLVVTHQGGHGFRRESGMLEQSAQHLLEVGVG